MLNAEVDKLETRATLNKGGGVCSRIIGEDVRAWLDVALSDDLETFRIASARVTYEKFIKYLRRHV